MSNEENGCGLLGGIVLGAGFAGMILLPFYLAQRLGANVIVGAQALLCTVMAIFSDDLVAMATKMQDCGYMCFSAPAAKLILEMDKIGMWTLAAVAWLLLGMMILANSVALSQPAAKQ